MTRTISPSQQRAEASEAERRRVFIERMEHKLRSKELAYAARHGYVRDVVRQTSHAL